MRLGIVSTHPIQYHSPWYRYIVGHAPFEIEVLYCHRATAADQAAAGFGVAFEWDVDLLAGYPHRFLENRSAAPGRGFSGYDVPGMGEAIRAGGFDAVLVSGWHYKAAWQAFFACWKAGIPILARGDSQLEGERPAWKSAAMRALYPRFIKRFAACLSVGKRSREYFLHFGARPDHVFFCPHCAPTRPVPSREESAAARAHWGLPPEGPVFMFAGKLTEMKRPLDFLRAMAVLSERGERVAGLVIGDGPLRGACEETVRQRGLTVRFTGFLNQSEIGSAYAAGDVLVLPSDGRETWGLVVNEAMSMGRPCVVSTSVGCGPDLVEPGKTGAVFPARDWRALADRMTDLTRSSASFAEMGLAARARVAGYGLDAATTGLRLAMGAALDAGDRG